MRRLIQGLQQVLQGRPQVRLRPERRPVVEALEGRALLSGVHARIHGHRPPNAFVQTNLVSDQAGTAQVQDTNLVNAWGIALSPKGGNIWISANGTGVSTLYRGDVAGSPIAKQSLVVSIPGGSPTGAVFNGTSDFMINSGTSAAPALFIFDSEAGQITAWNPKVPTITQAVTEVNNPNTVYKGLALGANASGNVLYAANFRNGSVDVFDTHFHQITPAAGAFQDSRLPRGYAPFDVAFLNGKVYVTYALQNAQKHDDVSGRGHGFVDVFSPDGQLMKRLIKRGQLDSPWGLAIAPANFGAFSNDLLVGNFGNGWINAYDANTGAFKGTLKGTNHQPLVIDGLWGLNFGNGVTGNTNTLLFTAGPGGEQHGLFGTLDATGG